jgi:hypothetical protein
MVKHPETPDELLSTWDKRLLMAMNAHYVTASRYARRNKQFGIPCVVLAAVIATLAFATIRVNSMWVSLAVGFLGTLQVVLSSLHTWFRYSETAEEHRQAGARYAAIRRQIELVRAFSGSVNGIQSSAVTEIRLAMDALGREAPTVPADIWKQTHDAMQTKGKVDIEEMSPVSQTI